MLDIGWDRYARDEDLELYAVPVETFLRLGSEGPLEQQRPGLGLEEFSVVGENAPHHLHVRRRGGVDALPAVGLDIRMPVLLVPVPQLPAAGPDGHVAAACLHFGVLGQCEGHVVGAYGEWLDDVLLKERLGG